MIFTTMDYGKTIIRYSLPFTPSDVTFHQDKPLVFLSHDKSDPKKQVSTFTTSQNGGDSFLFDQVLNHYENEHMFILYISH